MVFLGDIVPRARGLANWERMRNKKQVHWLVECFAEFLGVFFYTYFGAGSTAPWVVGNIIKEPGLSNVLQIGLAYAFGIIFALVVCSATSGGHFSPGITIASVIFKGFPKFKALRYIVAQILGAYLAATLVYFQWKPIIQTAEEVLMAGGPVVFDSINYTPNGLAGIFALYLLPQQKIGYAFLNEFVNCTVLSIIIWACLDPTNLMIPPSSAPFIIGLAYGAAIWGFAAPGVALNTARDLGGRFFAVSIWGSKAWGGNYAAVAALTNIPATLFGGMLYEIFLADSDRVVSKSSLEYLQSLSGHRRTGSQHATKVPVTGDDDNSSHEKGHTSYTA
ncbi:putative aquaporin 2 [Crepidotus variabilis]|uniref:Aquaporin 2 n=1 Tax=Crepidotus variabilis TaxID=179855 RepID=A0A9P6JU60_9AGAR|nr:putative aquaporin 2 [Crepidotus variabilis]